MSKRSRERFRPPWQGKFNPSRDRYSAAFVRERDWKLWDWDWERFRNPICPEHIMPRREDYGCVHRYLEDVAKWERYAERFHREDYNCVECDKLRRRFVQD